MIPLRNLNHLPQHVAIIMDGNGRWAKRHHLSRLEGHKKGALGVQQVVEVFIEYGIPYLTLYTFSTENWNRPKVEVDGLFELLDERLNEGISLALEKGIKLYHMGKLDGLPPKIQEKIQSALELTQYNTQITLSLAFNYGGRDEIVEATHKIIRKGIAAQDVDESVVSQHLFSAGIPDPDLIIRTGGEKRLSNFLLWQSAYAEIYFTQVLWPDFNRDEIVKSLRAYSKRKRRFGSLDNSVS